MIARYSRPEMVAIWSPETKYRIWFEIEAHACDALAQLGLFQKKPPKLFGKKGGPLNLMSIVLMKLKPLPNMMLLLFNPPC